MGFDWGEATKGGVSLGLPGTLIGFLGGQNDDQKNLLEDYRKQVMGRPAPQAGAAAQANTSDFRTNQQGLVGRLEAMANGTGPSLAADTLRQATDANTAKQQSIAQSGRGNATLANIVAANNSNNFGQSAAQQAAIQRTAEQLGATAQLGGVVQGARGQDEGISQFNAQQTNFRDQANLEAKLRAMGLNDEAILRVMQQTNAINAQPTFGDQLLAGATGALGMATGQMGGAKAAGGGAGAGLVKG